MMYRSLPRVTGPLVLGLGLLIAPGLSWAQRQATPAPIEEPVVAPPVVPAPTADPMPSPSPAVLLVDSDMPLCSELTERLPLTVAVKYVDCKSDVGVACISKTDFYGASLICSNVIVRSPATPTPLPAQ